MKLKYHILTLLLFCTTYLYAQDVKFTASVSKNEVATGEQFQVDFSINGQIDEFTPPNFSGFQVLSGPNTSQSVSIINGRTTVSAAYSYILMGVKEGEFTIGSATTTYNGRKLSTNEIKIKVIKGRPVQTNRQNLNATDDGVQQGNSADLSKSLFIRAVVDKSNVYVGQQITLSYRLYTKIGIEQSQVDKLPDLNGFWNEDVKNLAQQQQQAQWHIETLNGVRYEAADIKQTILFPDHAGNLTIDPIEMTFLVRQQAPARDIMDQFFGSFKEVKYKVKSPPVVIHAKPTPDAGKPDSFTGAVGHFTMETTIDKNELKANEALNYKIKITGAGNIKLLKTLNTSFPADFEKYDPKVSDTITTNESGVSGSRMYNYLLIPRHQGDYTIEPFKFSYFNPATNKYVTLTAQPFHIKVNKGLNENNVTAFSADKQDIKQLGKDIRYIKDDAGSLTNQSESFFGSFFYYLLLLLGPAACYAAFVYRNKVRKDNSDIVAVKSRRAAKLAAKHLANAHAQLTARNSKEFFEAIFKGLYGYLSDKLNIPPADLDRENIASALKDKGLDDAPIKQLLDTLDLCEMARYAPVTHISAQEVYDKAKGVIQDIENKI